MNKCAAASELTRTHTLASTLFALASTEFSFRSQLWNECMLNSGSNEMGQFSGFRQQFAYC